MSIPKAPPTITLEPVLLDRVSACQFLQISATTLDKLVAQGQAPKPKKITNGRVGWLTEELRAWARALPVSDLLPPRNSGVGRGGAAAAQST